MPQLILAALDPLGVVMTVLGLGFLVFFHELGHFLACRLTRTRVEAFSVGFGPTLVGWRRGGTLYKIGAIPLGGYVKMAAENPGDQNTGAPDEFPNKSFLQRLFIMSNGVIFNLLLAFGFYLWAFGIGVPLNSTELGAVEPGDPAWVAGLSAGDRVTHVDGEPVASFEDLKLAIAFSDAGESLRLTVERDGRTLEFDVEPRYSESLGMPAIGIHPALERVVAEVEAGSPVAKAGGRKGDVVLGVNGVATPGFLDIGPAIGRVLGRAGGEERVPLTLRVRRESGEEEDLSVELPVERIPQIGVVPQRGRRVRAVRKGSPFDGLVRPGDAIVSLNGGPVEDLGLFVVNVSGRTLERLALQRDGRPVEIVPDRPLTDLDLAGSVALHETDKAVVVPRAGMPAETAGLLAGDEIVAAGGEEVRDWTALQKVVRSRGLQPLTVVVLRDGERKEVVIEPTAMPDPSVTLGYVTRPAVTIRRETSVLKAAALGWDQTVTVMQSVLLTIRSLVTRQVSVENIGGPILLAQVTYGMFDLGWGRYLSILALISVNLAILNLLPIPVLDGGQIVLLCAEKLRGKPLPDRVVGYFQLVGLVMILGLMLLAFHNDIARLLK